MNQPDRGVIGGRAAAGVIHMVQIARRMGSQPSTQFGRWHVGRMAERIVILHLHHLSGDRIGHFPATMADIDAPQPGNPIEECAAIGVGHIHAAGRFDDLTAFGMKRAEVGIGV